MIQGMHHVSMKCSNAEEYAAVRAYPQVQSGGISAVAIATPGMILLDLSFLVCPTIPATPPEIAMMTSKKLGLVRANSCSVGSLTGDNRK